MTIVYGDTISALARALTAVNLHIPEDHAEVALRSYDKRMPKEINRILIDHVSNLPFCPTVNIVNNLHRKGFINIMKSGSDFT